MFTGIVTAVGSIRDLQPLERGVRALVEAGALGLDDVQVGDSIAVNGACLTVIEKRDGMFAADISAETLRCTAGLDRIGNRVNLEKALRLCDRLGGHLMAGHVDGVGVVERFEPRGESWELVIAAPRELAKYIAAKGSITVDGVSLTVNQVEGERFWVNIIPHTYQATNFSRLTHGFRVNLEVDLLARYLERLRSAEE